MIFPIGQDKGNTGVVIGVPVGIAFFVVFILTPICLGVIIFWSARRRHREGSETHTSVDPTIQNGSHSPAPSAPYLTEFVQSSQQTPNSYSSGKYKDTQFSAGEAPPSYKAATAIAYYQSQVYREIEIANGR